MEFFKPKQEIKVCNVNEEEFLKIVSHLGFLKREQHGSGTRGDNISAILDNCENKLNEFLKQSENLKEKDYISLYKEELSSQLDTEKQFPDKVLSRDEIKKALDFIHKYDIIKVRSQIDKGGGL